MIMINHTLAKVFAMTLDEFISSFFEMHNLHAPGQASFRTNYLIVDHILTL